MVHPNTRSSACSSNWARALPVPRILTSEVFLLIHQLGTQNDAADAENLHIDEPELGRYCLASPMSAAINPRRPQIVDQDIDADQKHPHGQYSKTPANEGAADEKYQCQ